MKKVAIIGAGAAGCFCAQRLREIAPEIHVELFEAHSKPLGKVAVTGGGRCNLTNSFAMIGDLREAYPRGFQLMRRLMHQWSQWDTMGWFEEHGVRLLTQDDECVFPVSQNAMEIVAVLRRGLDIHTSTRIDGLHFIEDERAWELSGVYGKFDAVVVTTGGSRRFEWLLPLGLELEMPVPSLFPFRLEPSGLEALSGIVVDDAALMIPSTGFRAKGALLVTHNGLSGPAALRLSSYAARYLAGVNYKTQVLVNWLGDCNEEEARSMIREIADQNPSKLVASHPMVCGSSQGGTAGAGLSSRHWHFLLERSGIGRDVRWNGVGKKLVNRLAATLVSDMYKVTGRVPHKEEFVTAGGVSLENLNAHTLQCKAIPGLYFAGEVCDVDGVTGGFNLQAAWTMADAVARSVSHDTMPG